MTAQARPMQPAQAPRGPMDTLRAFGARHRSITIILGMALVTAVLPIIVLMPGLSGLSSQTVWIDELLHRRASTSCWPWASTWSWAWPACWTWDTRRSSPSAPMRTRTVRRASPVWTSRSGSCSLIGALVAAVFGILLGAPTLRLRGDYLAIVTLGFGEIVPVVFKNADKWTNGTNGIAGISRPEFPGVVFGALSPVPYYITIAVLITIAMVLLYRLQDSRLGRSWQAIREDELAAASNGINTVTTKLLAFALGASTAGLAGVFNASKLVFVSPDQFLFQVSFTVLAMVVLGGIGNIWGVALGAFIIYTIQSVVLKQLNALFDTDPRADPERPGLHAVPVPAVWPCARRHDAAATRRPVPEQAEGGGAPCHGTSSLALMWKASIPKATWVAGMSRDRAVLVGRLRGGGGHRRQRRTGDPAPRQGHHQALRWPGGRQPGGAGHPQGIHGQPHRAERGRQDHVLQCRGRHPRPDRGRDHVPGPAHGGSSGASLDRAVRLVHPCRPGPRGPLAGPDDPRRPTTWRCSCSSRSSPSVCSS